jgi:hypothetical protein
MKNRTELHSSVSGHRPVVGFFANGTEPLGYVKVEEFIDKLTR